MFLTIPTTDLKYLSLKYTAIKMPLKTAVQIAALKRIPTMPPVETPPAATKLITAAKTDTASPFEKVFANGAKFPSKWRQKTKYG